MLWLLEAKHIGNLLDIEVWRQHGVLGHFHDITKFYDLY